jgi:hypothetical protein
MMRKAVLCKLVAFLGLAVVIALPAVCGAQQASAKAAAPAATPPPAASGDKLCPNPPPCKAGHTCSNYPFVPTDCWTTKHGPAKADVIIAPALGAVRSTNMLYCEGNTYALCFFSGPPDKGLPCALKGDTANCTCQAYTSGPNFVDINGILNQGAYFETVDLCGQDGSRCRNIVNCGPGGNLKGCKKRPEAPVCKYVKNQNPKDPQASLMPKADLISTFSFAMSGKNGPYKLGSTPCSGLYAGCMTAPCTYGPDHKSPTTDGEPVQCQCPTYNGKNYQIGQKLPSCSIPSGYTWSAANTVKPKSGGK